MKLLPRSTEFRDWTDMRPVEEFSLSLQDLPPHPETWNLISAESHLKTMWSWWRGVKSSISVNWESVGLGSSPSSMGAWTLGSPSGKWHFRIL